MKTSLTDFFKALGQTFSADIVVAASPTSYKGEFRQFIKDAKRAVAKSKKATPVVAYVYETDNSGKVRIQMEVDRDQLAA